ncbi:hypothetical protein Xekk_02875 [Xenorhabdus sp. KK7.4]|nr:hypothetical protein Xekk_02875 [Xenorhabdus sp. KK7.4]
MPVPMYWHNFAPIHSIPCEKTSTHPNILNKRRSPIKLTLYGAESVELADKPGSVVDNHSSRPELTRWLKQPTRVRYGPYHVNLYLVLLRVEFTVPRTVTSRAVRSYRTLSPLPDLSFSRRKAEPSAVCSLLHWS